MRGKAILLTKTEVQISVSFLIRTNATVLLSSAVVNEFYDVILSVAEIIVGSKVTSVVR